MCWPCWTQPLESGNVVRIFMVFHASLTCMLTFLDCCIECEGQIQCSRYLYDGGQSHWSLFSLSIYLSSATRVWIWSCSALIKTVSVSQVGSEGQSWRGATHSQACGRRGKRRVTSAGNTEDVCRCFPAVSERGPAVRANAP